MLTSYNSILPSTKAPTSRFLELASIEVHKIRLKLRKIVLKCWKNTFYLEGTLIDNISTGCSWDTSNISSFEFSEYLFSSKIEVVPHATMGIFSFFGLHASNAERLIVFTNMCLPKTFPGIPRPNNQSSGN